MSRWKHKWKLWHDRRSRLLNTRKHKRSKRRGGQATIKAKDSNSRKNEIKSPPSITLKPPKCFSLINNPEETMQFFMDFAAEIERREYGKHFFIDSKNVENVTVDSLIYLIAILQNEELNVTMRYSFAGNYPNNIDAFKVYAESGFNDYVKSHMKKMPKSNEKMCIVNGIGNKSEVSKGLCDFIINELGKSRIQILPLQKVLIELMSNVYYHAYEKNTFMAKKWYMYAEHVNDFVRCVFVDTGQGIAKTVRKNFGEKLVGLFGVGIDDSKLIQSAFKGDFRTATNEKHRGNGLSSVRANIENELFENFEVLSGHGRCIFPKGDSVDEMIIMNYEKNLYGTLYTFIIR